MLQIIKLCAFRFKLRWDATLSYPSIVNNLMYHMTTGGEDEFHLSPFFAAFDHYLSTNAYDDPG